MIAEANQLIINGINEKNTTQNQIEKLLSQLDQIETRISYFLDDLFAKTVSKTKTIVSSSSTGQLQQSRSSSLNIASQFIEILIQQESIKPLFCDDIQEGKNSEYVIMPQNNKSNTDDSFNFSLSNSQRSFEILKEKNQLGQENNNDDPLELLLKNGSRQDESPNHESVQNAANYWLNNGDAIELLSIENNSFHQASQPNTTSIKNLKSKKEKVSRKVITKCAHTQRPFYAKGLCENCYHQSGRHKNADKCPHTNRISYVRGICKICYLKEYHEKRKMDPVAKAAAAKRRRSRSTNRKRGRPRKHVQSQGFSRASLSTNVKSKLGKS